MIKERVAGVLQEAPSLSLQVQQCARDLEAPLLLEPGAVRLPPFAPGERVVRISASGYHSVAVTNKGRCLTLGKLVKAADIVGDYDMTGAPREGGADYAYGDDGAPLDEEVYDDFANDY